MKYLGMDVHSRATVWCLLDGDGEPVARGSVETNARALGHLASELSCEEEILAGQEVGTMSYLVHDAFVSAGVRMLSFNAYRLRMIASSRKKTDRRDAYWIAKALASGMYPPPVFIPTGEVRELRAVLSRRRMVHRDLNRWRHRARAYLRGAGQRVGPGAARLQVSLERRSAAPQEGEEALTAGVGLCHRQAGSLALELQGIDQEIQARARQIEPIRNLMTMPGVGVLVGTTIYAAVGEIGRFPDAKSLGAYAGLVPSVRNTGGKDRFGSITKEGSTTLRTLLVQSAHTVMHACRSEGAKPLQAIGARVQTSRRRRKIAVVALARHILRIAYYILRDGTTYDGTRLGGQKPEVSPAT